MVASPNATEALALAKALADKRRITDSLMAYDFAEAVGANADECAGGRWSLFMMQGSFDEAWAESDAIRARGARDEHRFWNGESLEGRSVIVRCLHGLGDAVHFLSYCEQLSLVARHVIVELPPALLELAPYFRGIGGNSSCEVVTWGDQAPRIAPEWELQIEVTELPYIFRTTVTDLPIAERYLQLSTQVIEEAALRMGPRNRLRVGLVWAAASWNRARCIPFAMLSPLLEIADVEFWSLQGGEAAAQWIDLTAQAENLDRLRDAAILGPGLLSLASVIANLDLVITVDTLAAHLTGALGKPGWVLLQFTADWRWMVERQDTPWYPSLRLFRQANSEDWPGVVNELQANLKKFAEHPPGCFPRATQGLIR